MSDAGGSVTLILYKIGADFWKEPFLNLVAAAFQMSSFTHVEMATGALFAYNTHNLYIAHDFCFPRRRRGRYPRPNVQRLPRVQRRRWCRTYKPHRPQPPGVHSLDFGVCCRCTTCLVCHVPNTLTSACSAFAKLIRRHFVPPQTSIPSVLSYLLCATLCH